MEPPLFLKGLTYLLFFLKLAASSEDEFTFNGFSGANLSLDGIASITSNGILRLTNGILRLTNETKQMKGHAFHPDPLHFRTSPDGNVFSFSTTFVFVIVSEYTELGGHGIAFLISPTKDLSKALPSAYLGLFNSNNNGNSTNHIFAVELDTILSSEFQDINDNHVGIDINSLKSNAAITAGYYADDTGLFNNLTLISGKPMQVWIDYDGQGLQLNVTMSTMEVSKPKRPLLSSTIDLFSVMLDTMGPFGTAAGIRFLLSELIPASERVFGAASVGQQKRNAGPWTRSWETRRDASFGRSRCRNAIPFPKLPCTVDENYMGV